MDKIYIWELDTISFENLADFHLGTWQIIVRRVGVISPILLPLQKISQYGKQRHGTTAHSQFARHSH